MKGIYQISISTLNGDFANDWVGWATEEGLSCFARRRSDSRWHEISIIVRCSSYPTAVLTSLVWMLEMRWNELIYVIVTKRKKRA